MVDILSECAAAAKANISSSPSIVSIVIQEFRFNKAPFSEHANIPFHLFVMICIFSVLRVPQIRNGVVVYSFWLESSLGLGH